MTQRVLNNSTINSIVMAPTRRPIPITYPFDSILTKLRYLLVVMSWCEIFHEYCMHTYVGEDAGGQSDKDVGDEG